MKKNQPANVALKTNATFKSLLITLMLALLLLKAAADPRNPNTDWMSASWGVGFHYLQDKFPESMNGGSAAWNATVNSFDVNKFVDGVQRSGAKWVLFTLGQNSGYYCSPNATLDRYSGYKAGERNSTRDLPMDIAKALKAKGIRMVLYLPSNAPAADSKIANGLGVTTMNGGNWVINTTFLNRWKEVISEWSVRYGDYVDGWWFDGWYSGSGFKDAYGSYYRDAVRKGNPKAVFCVNTGLNANGLKLGTNAADYSALEARDLNYVCNNRWISNSSGTIGPMQWATFTLLGGGWWTEGSRDRYTDVQVNDYMTSTFRNGGAITWATYVDAKGAMSERQIALLRKAAPGGGGGCTPTAVNPYTQVNGGAWSNTSTATLNAGGTVKFGPQPTTGGNWRWTGPNNFSATTREITISNIQTNQAGNYTATYTNASGCSSAAIFKITVNTTTPNVAPTVSITSPSNNTMFTAPASVTINVNASDSDGSISKVDFYNGTTLLASDNISPYAHSWGNVAAGTYTITARATDDKGAIATSTSITITINNPPTNGCSGIPVYIENAGYVAGSVVQNAGGKFECKPWPYSGWCNGAAWAYAPRTGAYWQDAWTQTGTCSSAKQSSVVSSGVINIYPNPSSGIITIELNTANYSEYILFNSVGEEVLNGILSDTLDISSLEQGVYTLQIKSGSVISVNKIVKY